MAIHIAALPTASRGKAGTAAAYAMGTFCWFLSAGVYIAAKWVAPEMPPWTFCFWRVLIAALVLLPVVRNDFGLMREALLARPLELLVIGGLGLAICQGFIYVGLHYADAITAGIIMALMPIMTMVIARFVLGERMTLLQVAGAAIAFIGMAVIVSRGDPAALLGLNVNPGELWIVASALCFGIYTVLLKRAKFETPRLPLLVLLLGAGTVVSLPFWLFELATGQHSALDSNGYIALFYAAVPGGALMYYLYNWSVEALGASKASLLLYSQTVFVAILAYWILGERLHPYHLAGAACIVAGIVLANVIGGRAKAAA